MNFSEIKNGKILIVDDNLANTKLLEKILKISGYHNIQTVNDSREFFRKYNEFEPDVILLDLNMPFIDGIEVMRKLHENDEESLDYIPVIVITAQNDQLNMKKAFEVGASDFVGKPFNNDEILLRIKNMLKMRLLHKEVLSYNGVLEQKVKERTKDLQDLQVELIQRLGRVLEYRDNETGYHVTRMSLYVKELAIHLGLPEDDIQLLYQASSMHDIGKISVSDQILLKPGKLSDEERETMQLHTIHGAHILTGSSFRLIQLAEEISLSHHEKWDGTGYPKGLKGEEIPLYSRMVAICDVFDALTSERPYKKAWTVEEAKEEIMSQSGRHFDPFIVEKFLEILPQVVEIMEHYKQLELLHSFDPTI